jgi:hypothetical protein
MNDDRNDVSTAHYAAGHAAGLTAYARGLGPMAVRLAALRPRQDRPPRLTGDAFADPAATLRWAMYAVLYFACQSLSSAGRTATRACRRSRRPRRTSAWR